MIVNNSSHRLTFGEKYSTKTILEIASKKDFSKAEAVNFINSITKLNKSEKKEILKVDNIAFSKYLQSVSEYLINQIPGLKKYVIQLNSDLYKKDDVYNNAIVSLGDKINVKRLIIPKNKKITT